MISNEGYVMYFYTDYSTVESASLKPKVERDRGYAWVVLTASFMCQVGNFSLSLPLLHSSQSMQTSHFLSTLYKESNNTT